MHCWFNKHHYNPLKCFINFYQYFQNTYLITLGIIEALVRACCFSFNMKQYSDVEN